MSIGFGSFHPLAAMAMVPDPPLEAMPEKGVGDSPVLLFPTGQRERLRWTGSEGLLRRISNQFYPIPYVASARGWDHPYSTPWFQEGGWLDRSGLLQNALDRLAALERAGDGTQIVDLFCSNYDCTDDARKKTNIFGYLLGGLSDPSGQIYQLFYDPPHFLEALMQLKAFWEAGETSFERAQVARVTAFEGAASYGAFRENLRKKILDRRPDEETSVWRLTSQSMRDSGSQVMGLYRALREYELLIMWNRFFRAVERLGVATCIPQIASTPGIRFIDLRNPSLVIQEQKRPSRIELKSGSEIVPATLHLDPNKPVILLTGGNGNGKTQTLEAVANALQSTYGGIRVLAASAEIEPLGGLEYNVDLSRHSLTASAFQNEMLRYREVFDEIDKAHRAGLPAVVLMDEPCRGTGRDDGYALTSGFIAGCLARGAYVVMTTHFNQIGHYLNDTRIQVMTVDGDHRLREGAGESGAISLARRLGFPDSIVTEAEEIYRQSRNDGAIRITPLEFQEGPTTSAHGCALSPEDAVELGMVRGEEELEKFVEGKVPDILFKETDSHQYAKLGPAGLLLAEDSPIALAMAHRFAVSLVDRSWLPAASDFKDRIRRLPLEVQHYTIQGLLQEQTAGTTVAMIRALCEAEDAVFYSLHQATGTGAFFAGLFPTVRSLSAAKVDEVLGRPEEDIEDKTGQFLRNVEWLIRKEWPKVPSKFTPDAVAAVGRAVNGYLNRFLEALEPLQGSPEFSGIVASLRKIYDSDEMKKVHSLWREITEGLADFMSELVRLKEGDPDEIAYEANLFLSQKLKDRAPAFFNACVDAKEALDALRIQFYKINFLLGAASAQRDGWMSRAQIGPQLSIRNAKSLTLLSTKTDREVIPIDWNGIDFSETPVVFITGTNGGGKTNAAQDAALYFHHGNHLGLAPGEDPMVPQTGRVIAAIQTAEHSGAASSFMNELARVLRILKAIDEDPRRVTVIVIDELFKGTAGDEAAALQIATLRYLAARGMKVIVTTNYTELYEILDRMPEGTLPHRPLFVDFFGERRFQVQEGRGRSSGIEVAAEFGLPDDVIAYAKQAFAALQSSDQPQFPPLPDFAHGKTP